MPPCIKNPKKHYTGKEPSPKGLGYCASSEKESTIMKGKDGKLWIKSKGKWIRYINKEELEEQIHNDFSKKLYNWWRNLAQGNIIIIYTNGKHKLIKSESKTHKAQSKEIIEKWKLYDEDKDVKAIIWSAQSSDIIDGFIEYLIDNSSKDKLKELLKKKDDLPSYLLDNYKKYFVKSEYIGKKDYTLKM